MNPETCFTAIVVGLGTIGLGLDFTSPSDHIYTHVKALHRHPQFKLIAGVDPLEARRREFQNFTGLPSYESISQAIRVLNQVDLVVLATPTPIRLAVMQLSLALKPKLFLVEKPLAANLDEAIEIINLCRCQRVMLAVNYFRFFLPSIQKVMAFANDLQFGPLTVGVCHYSGGLLNNATHFVSLLIQWYGTPVATLITGEKQFLDSRDANIPFRLNFANGSVLFLPHQVEYSIGELDMFFPRGRIQFLNYAEDVRVFQIAQDPCFPAYRRLLPLMPHPQSDLQHYQFEVYTALAQALAANSPESLNAANALETFKVCWEVLHAP